MNATLKQMIPIIETWSEDDQAALLAFAREIEQQRVGVYSMSPDEELAVGEGLAEADRGEFISDEATASIWRKFAGR